MSESCEFSVEQKQDLVQLINGGLPKDKMKKLVMVVKESPTYQGSKETIKVDMDNTDPETLKKIQDCLLA